MLMTSHNIHFHDKVMRFHLNVPNFCFLELSEGFPRDSKTS